MQPFAPASPARRTLFYPFTFFKTSTSVSNPHKKPSHPHSNNYNNKYTYSNMKKKPSRAYIRAVTILRSISWKAALVCLALISALLYLSYRLVKDAGTSPSDFLSYLDDDGWISTRVLSNIKADSWDDTEGVSEELSESANRLLEMETLKYPVDPNLLAELPSEFKQEYLQWRKQEEHEAYLHKATYFDSVANSKNGGRELTPWAEARRALQESLNIMMPRPYAGNGGDGAAGSQHDTGIPSGEEEEEDDSENPHKRIPDYTEDDSDSADNAAPSKYSDDSDDTSESDEDSPDFDDPSSQTEIPKDVAGTNLGWVGDISFLIKNGLPTCMGVPCNKTQYLDMIANLTVISRYMTRFWKGVELSRMTFVPEHTLIATCRHQICPNIHRSKEKLSHTDANQLPCGLPESFTLDTAPPKVFFKSYPRLRRMAHILTALTSTTKPSSHCVRSMSPYTKTPETPPFDTNFHPATHMKIGKYLPRARLVGSNICKILNKTSNAYLSHHCERLPVKYIPAKLEKKQRQRKQVVEPYPVRYLKVETFLFHNPVIVALGGDSIVTESGHIFHSQPPTSKKPTDSPSFNGFWLFPHSSCGRILTSGFASRPTPSTLTVSEVFVASEPGLDTPPTELQARRMGILSTLSRLAPHLEELEQMGSLKVHVNAGETEGVVRSFLRFLRKDGMLKRLVSGAVQVRGGGLYVPEQTISCATPGSWQARKLRDLIAGRFKEIAEGLKVKLDEEGEQEAAGGLKPLHVLVIRPTTSSQVFIKNYDALINTLNSTFLATSTDSSEPISFSTTTPQLRILTDTHENLLPLAHTLELFHTAKVIIAPQSHLLSHLVGSQQGTSILEFLPRDESLSFAYSTLARTLGMDWYGIVPEEDKTGGGGRVVDVDMVKAVVAAMLNKKVGN
ncbi:hypothetical protein HDV05_005131 [Chytridiales sp. JEL 0842]|nr:hypothetical protein HDV05_005131 [Chytridiales sp. JEL 0842]